MIVSKYAFLAALPLTWALSSLALPAQEQEGQPEADDVDPQFVELQVEMARVPFTIEGPRPIPIVEAMVNGEGPFRFYYDTGASVCVLDSAFVEELGIQVLGDTQIGDHTASARIPAQRVQMESLELEGMRFEGVPAAAFDRSRYGGGTIRGVLGLPLFREHLLTVDYANGRLLISDERLPEKGQGIVAYGGGLLPEIAMTVGGKEYPIHIDSGSPGGFTLPASIVESLPLKSEPRIMGRARTVNSEFEIWSAQLDATITIAGNEFDAPQVGYNEILPTGLIGYQILKDLEVSIDQRSQRVRLVPAQAEASADTTDG